MARRNSVALDDLVAPEPTGIGVINPGTRKAGTVAFRCVVALSVSLLVVYVAQLRWLLQAGAVAIRNAAGLHADRLTGTHHAGRPLHAGPMPWKAIPSNLVITVAAALVVAIAVWRLTKATRDDMTETRGMRLVFIVVASVAGAAVVLLLLGQWEPAKHPVAVALRAVAQAAGSLAQFFAGVGK